MIETVLPEPRVRAGGPWPWIGAYDVVVVGAGPGGIGAALAAAETGTRTLAVEREGSPGGMMTHGNCPHIMGLCDAERPIVGGVAERLIRRLGESGWAALCDPKTRCPDPEPIGTRPLRSSVIASAEGVRVMVNRLFREAGVETLFYSSLLAAETDGRRLTAIAVDRREGPGWIRAPVFVDATGDAHLVWRAGGTVREAPVEQAMTKTLLMDVGGVTEFDHAACGRAFQNLVKDGRSPVAGQDAFMAYGALDPGVVTLNVTLTGGNALRSDDLTRMDRELREQIQTCLEWFRRHMPGFQHAYLVRTPSVVGVRAGRTAVGIATLGQSDIDNATPVRDPVALGQRYYGDHGLTRFQSPWIRRMPGPLPIPWRTLLCASFENVAMAGRCLSIEPHRVTCVRLIATCMATGEAAGVTAALAAGRTGGLSRVAYEEVRERLLQRGAILA